MLIFLLTACRYNECSMIGEVIFDCFMTNIDEIEVGKEVETIFTACLITDEKINSVTVQTESGEILGYLYDDGVGSDETVNDNIFTGNIILQSDEEMHQNVFASVNGINSEIVDIFFYEELTKDDFEKFSNVNLEIMKIQQKYVDEEGYVKEESIRRLLTGVSEYLKKEGNSNNVASYQLEDDSVYIKFNNGIRHIFIPHLKGVMSSGESKRIVTVEPINNSFGITSSLGFAWLDKYMNNLEYQGGYDVSSNARMITNVDGSYYYDNKYSGMNLSSTEYIPSDDDQYINYEVSIENCKKLAQSGIIIWEGHGGYAKEIGSALITSEQANLIDNFLKYSADLKEGRLVTTGGWYTFGTDFLFCNYGITSKFFDYYYSDDSLEQCLVYLGACHSGTDSRLADSLLNKGAKGVYCSKGTINMEYEILMRTTIFYNLTKRNDEGNYLTTKDALGVAYKIIGENDFHHNDTYITYFGDNEYSLFDNEILNHEYDNKIQENDVNTKQIDLTQYLDIFADFYNVAGGYYSDETGDHENWVIGEGIQYGNYFESPSVDEIIISSSKYSLFGLYVGMNIESAKMCLNEWNIETEMDYSKGDMHIWLDIDESRMINEFGFWKDIQRESYLKNVLEKWQSGDYYGELIDENANRDFVGKLSYGESYYYGEYDANGDRSGIGVAVYKIKHGNDGDFRSAYYLGEWKNGMREGVGEWVLKQSDYWGGGISYCCKCNWINDFPEGSISISWWSYDAYCAIEGTVSQGLFDNEIKKYNSSSEKQNPMHYNYSNGYVYVNFIDESKGDYRYAVCVDDQDNIGYFEEDEVDKTHGIWGFADLIY